MSQALREEDMQGQYIPIFATPTPYSRSYLRMGTV